MLKVVYAECPKLALFAECHYAECRYAECRSAKDPYGLPTCNNYLRSDAFNTKNDMFFFFTKQAILMRRRIVPSLSVQ
jgi:hypothetical protein